MPTTPVVPEAPAQATRHHDRRMRQLDTYIKTPSRYLFAVFKCFKPANLSGPWIIRTRYGPQPEEKAAWSLHVEAPGGSPHG